MILTDYRFLLDIHEINSQISLSFKQGDTGRVLYITLTENGDIFNIPQGSLAVFTALKPDGTIIFNDCEINGNEIVYTHTAQTAAVTGKVDCELRLYGAGNTLITSPHFTIFVHPTVYADQIESKDEVNALTTLISEANTKLANGDFIPKLSVGSVTTLPAGTAATVELAGSPEAPVLNFGIPMGPQGQAESLIPDTALSLDSLKPVQNKVIAQAINERKTAFENHRDSKENPHGVTKSQVGLANVDNTSDENKPVSKAQAEALGKLVEKVEGKGLSTNDFTDEYREKLEGLGNYSLPVGGSAIGGVKNGGDIAIDSSGNMTVGDGSVTRTKLALNALYSPIVYLSATDNNLSIEHLDKILVDSYSNRNSITNINISQEISSNLPAGFVVAVVARYTTDVHINFSDGVRFGYLGQKSLTTTTGTSRYVKFSDTYGTIALQKLENSASSGDVWLVTGNMEVGA